MMKSFNAFSMYTSLFVLHSCRHTNIISGHVRETTRLRKEVSANKSVYYKNLFFHATFILRFFSEEVPGAKRGEAQTANRSDEQVTSAKELCNVTLSQSVLLPHCGNNTEAVLEGVMEECVGDVLVSHLGGVEYECVI